MKIVFQKNNTPKFTELRLSFRGNGLFRVVTKRNTTNNFAAVDGRDSADMPIADAMSLAHKIISRWMGRGYQFFDSDNLHVVFGENGDFVVTSGPGRSRMPVENVHQSASGFIVSRVHPVVEPEGAEEPDLSIPVPKIEDFIGGVA